MHDFYFCFSLAGWIATALAVPLLLWHYASGCKK